MATDFTNIDVTALAGGAASGAYTVVMTIIWLIIACGILFFIWYVLQFKHKVIIKKMTKQGFYVVQDKAREIKEDGEVKYWKLWKMKEQATIPPPEATNLTGNGKMLAEGYWSEETGIVWAEDQITRDDFKEKVIKKSTSGDGKAEFKSFEVAMKPFTTQERALQAARVTRAVTRKRKNLLEIITQLATPVVLVMLMICILIFWEDISKPIIEQSRITAEISKQNAEISAQNARILALVTDNGANLQVNQVVPASGGAS